MNATHEVTNQSTAFVGRNLYTNDPALQEGVKRLGAGWADAALRTLGDRLGSQEVAEWARQANAFPPQLRNFDRSGRRIDEVEFHPAWHEIMRLMVGAGRACRSLGRSKAGCTGSARREVSVVLAGGKRRPMPGHDDLRGRACDATPGRGGAGHRARLVAAHPLARLRPCFAPGRMASAVRCSAWA